VPRRTLQTSAVISKIKGVQPHSNPRQSSQKMRQEKAALRFKPCQNEVRTRIQRPRGEVNSVFEVGRQNRNRK